MSLRLGSEPAPHPRLPRCACLGPAHGGGPGSGAEARLRGWDLVPQQLTGGHAPADHGTLELKRTPGANQAPQQEATLGSEG